jgi:hypothetical protein
MVGVIIRKHARVIITLKARVSCKSMPLMQFRARAQHARSQQNTQHPDEFQINALIGT